MARSPKKKREKYTELIKFKLTPNEFLKLSDEAIDYGHSSVNIYARSIILNRNQEKKKISNDVIYEFIYQLEYVENKLSEIKDYIHQDVNYTPIELIKIEKYIEKIYKKINQIK